jgi:hypothetical protein
MFSDCVYRRLRMVELRKWRLLRPMTRARHIFALMATYGVGSRRDRGFVSRRIKSYRRRWLLLLEQLCEHQLWAPVGNIYFEAADKTDESRFDFAFGVCTRCMPTFVRWAVRKPRRRKKIHAAIIPCRKTNICPACFGAVSEQQYRQCRRVLNALQPQKAVRLTVRVETQFVPAAVGYDSSFQQTALLQENIRILRAALASRRVANGSALHKRLQRQTLGLFWRVLAIPRVGGWDVETRWVFLTERHAPPPETTLDETVASSDTVVELARRKSWRQQQTTTDEPEAVAEALLRFAKYPRQLLTGNIDLIAAWLHAARGSRIVSGMGLLQTAGSSLMKNFKLQDQQRSLERRHTNYNE